MKLPNSDIAKGVMRYCAELGADPMLVQGAGGNASWKEGSILWIKASGTWLANAEKEGIFIPADLDHLSAEIAEGNFSATPRIIGDITLRPSIETMLHALMPHRVVLHLHAVEILAHLVRANFLDCFNTLLVEPTLWAAVDYLKPGADLAAEIHAALRKQPSVNVIFLENHGVVIGGENVTEVNQILSQMTRTLFTDPAFTAPQQSVIPKPPDSLRSQYAPVPDLNIQQLALNHSLFERLSVDWALFPDHVVFLGPKAFTYNDWETLACQNDPPSPLPELVFIGGQGVYAKPCFTKSKQLQLRCYFDVISRQKAGCPLVSLTHNQIAELLDWDAEQYRMSLAK